MKKLIVLFWVLGFFAASVFAQQEVNMSFNDVKPYDVLIYPNPMTGEQFTVKSTEDIVRVEVVNVIGKVIKRVENDGFAIKKVPVLVGKCEKGLYLVKVSFEDDKMVIKKLLVK